LTQEEESRNGNAVPKYHRLKAPPELLTLLPILPPPPPLLLLLPVNRLLGARKTLGSDL
jgi:hypothetical protein